MAEPITLAVVGSIALTEGIKFLYAQTGEVLKRWRERRDAKAEAAQPNEAVAGDVKLPEVFQGQLVAPKIHFDAVERLGEEIAAVRKDLSDYAEGIEPVNAEDATLLAKVDALRQALEAVYQQRITFKGEHRPASGPTVDGHIDVQQVAGYVAGVRAKRIAGGSVSVDAKADRVEKDGQFIGVDVDTIGGNAP